MYICWYFFREMIIKKPNSWISLLFIWRGSILRKVWKRLFVITLFAVIVLYFRGHIYDYKVHLNPTIFTLIGLALAIFMGFCNSASYDRFWEGRKLWGALLNDTRSLTRQVLGYIKEENEVDREEKKAFIKMISALCWALNYQLRKKEDSHTQELQRLLSKEVYNEIQEKRFKPIAIMDIMARWLYKKYEEGRIDSIVLAQMDRQMNEFSTIIGGCERISNTPLPFPYRVLLHRTVYLYAFWLPFGLVDVVGLMMPVIVLLICYTFVSLDALIQEISEPFGEEENDLALDSICQTIEFSINEQIGIDQTHQPENNDYFVK